MREAAHARSSCHANGPQVWQALPVAHVLPAYLHPIGDQNASAWPWRERKPSKLDLLSDRRTMASPSITPVSIGCAAINDLMLDILAAVARKDYEDRRRRVAQGQAKAKGEGRFRGRKENVDKNRAIARALKKGSSWSDIQALTGCSRATVARVAAKQRPA
jgi:hypothetical protein